MPVHTVTGSRIISNEIGHRNKGGTHGLHSLRLIHSAPVIPQLPHFQLTDSKPRVTDSQSLLPSLARFWAREAQMPPLMDRSLIQPDGWPRPLFLYLHFCNRNEIRNTIENSNLTFPKLSFPRPMSWSIDQNLIQNTFAAALCVSSLFSQSTKKSHSIPKHHQHKTQSHQDPTTLYSLYSKHYNNRTPLKSSSSSSSFFSCWDRQNKKNSIWKNTYTTYTKTQSRARPHWITTELSRSPNLFTSSARL
jgi:hypothetical protein